LVAGLVLVVAVAGLAGQRYGGNLVGYGSLQPACQKVQPRIACLSYSVNSRNASYKAANAGKARESIVIYTVKDWFRYMDRGLVYPSNFLALRLVIIAYCLVALVAMLWERQFRFEENRSAWPILAIGLFYVAVVFLDNYGTYRSLGEPFAINGRYLLPALPILLIISHQNITAWLGPRTRYVLANAGWAALIIANIRLFF
jgi:hypothetical protein